jgi:hypothetical protein
MYKNHTFRIIAVHFWWPQTLHWKHCIWSWLTIRSLQIIFIPLKRNFWTCNVDFHYFQQMKAFSAPGINVDFAFWNGKYFAYFFFIVCVSRVSRTILVMCSWMNWGMKPQYSSYTTVVSTGIERMLSVVPAERNHFPKKECCLCDDTWILWTDSRISEQWVGTAWGDSTHACLCE